MKTILITGCSSGFGLETARHFLERDWRVIATMRLPQEDVLPGSERLRVIPLDVTDAESIRAVVKAAGPVAVLVNNAGIGVLNALEGTAMATIREVFETNTFGTMAMTQEMLPQFKQRKAGVHHQRHAQCDAETAYAALSLYREQGCGERLYRVARIGTSALQCEGAPGDTGTGAGDELWQERRPPGAESSPGGVCGFGEERVCGIAAAWRAHARAGRRGSGVAQGQ